MIGLKGYGSYDEHYTPLYFRMGDLEIEMYWKHAPNTCRNFAELSRRGYYNGVVFHRIITDFMVQGGDPTGTGQFKSHTVQYFNLHPLYQFMLIASPFHNTLD